MAATHFRRDLRAALLGVLTEFQVQNPGLLRAVYAARPEGIGEVPVAWIGNFREETTHDSGTRGRRIRASVVIVDQITENEETVQGLDDIVDALMDRFTLAVRRVITSIIAEVGSEDGEIPVGEAYYRTVEIGIEGIIREGRS